MKISTFCIGYLAALSTASTIPVNNAISLAAPGNVSDYLTSSSSSQAGSLRAISPLFKVQNPRVQQKAIRPLPVYMNAIAALTLLARENYFGQQLQGTFSEAGWLSVSIAIVPQNSPFINRYYVIWGIYLATLKMSTGTFKESEFGLEFNGNLVGQLYIGPSASSTNDDNDSVDDPSLDNSTETAYLSNQDLTRIAQATSPADLTLGSWSNLSDSSLAGFQYSQPSDGQTYTLSQPANLTANPSPRNPRVSIAYQLYGEVILPNRVYFSIMESIATELAVFGAADLVPPGMVFQSGMQNTYFVFKKFDSPPPARGLNWEYRWLFGGLHAIAQVMVHEKKFKEINATVLVDQGRGDVPVADIFLKSGRIGLQETGADVATA